MFKNIRKKTYLIVILAILVIFIGATIYIGNNSKNNMSDSTKKMVFINDNLEYNNTLFVPVDETAYCDQLSSLYGIANTNFEVYSIVGQSSNSFLCLRKDGLEYIYESENLVPLTVTTFKPNKIIISDIDQINSNQMQINEKSVLQKVLSDMTDKNEVQMPSVVSTIKQIGFISSYYPGIKLKFQYEHDTQGNCYITDNYSDTTWKIGDELMKYIMQ
jgi:hypothetical protein